MKTINNRDFDYDNDWDRHPPDRVYYDENMDNEMIEKNMVVMMINGDGDDDEDAADDDGWCILIFLVPNAECVMSRYLFFTRTLSDTNRNGKRNHIKFSSPFLLT